MRIGILGTGIVGCVLAGKLDELGHTVVVGTRNVEAAVARTEPGMQGQEPFSEWVRQHPGVSVQTFHEAATHGEIVINATSGAASLDALKAAGSDVLAGKVLIDVANPLDFSAGFPPTLSIVDTDSLAETIQREFPNVRVVKTLNTVNANVMAEPGNLGKGDHTMLLSGNDRDAKGTATALLNELGWRDVIDMGDLSNARGQEMYLALWIRLMGSLGPQFNFKIVR